MQAMRIFPEELQRHVTSQQLQRIAAHGPVWAEAKRASSAQLAAAHSMLLRLPCAATLPPDLNLSLMFLSIADTGASSVEELLESDTCDTELDDHIATITSAEDGDHLSFPAAAPFAALHHDSTVPVRSSMPDSAVPGGAEAWWGMDTDSRLGSGSTLRQHGVDGAHAWRPLGTSVEGQQAAEAAMGALVAAHAAAAPGLAEAGLTDVAAEDLAAVSAAAFECGWGVPDAPQAAREAAGMLRAASDAWLPQPGATSYGQAVDAVPGGGFHWGGHVNAPAWPDW